MALRLYSGRVLAAWVDELDHMNFLEFQRVADLATTEFFRLLQGGADGEAAPADGLDAVIVETHVRYRQELRLDADIAVDTALAAYDDKRCHLLHTLSSQGRTACTVEVLLLAFDLRSRRAARWSPRALERLASYAQSDGAGPEERAMQWVAPRADTSP